MSSSQQAANETTSAGLHGIERSKQGASGAIQTFQADKDHSAETYDGLTSSGKDKLESVQKKVSEAASNLQAEASAKVDDAVAQGQHDVEETKATGATYIDQAKALAGMALGAAEDALYRGAAVIAPANPKAPGLVTTIQATTSNALEATGGYLASAHAALTSEAPQATNQGIADGLDSAKSGTADTATAVATEAATTAQSAANRPSQAVSNTIDVAKHNASSLYNSATQTSSTMSNAESNAESTQTQDLKGAASGYTTAATKTAQAYTSRPQETVSAHTKSIQQGAQQPMRQAKGALNSRQDPVTPVGLPAEGLEGVLAYGEDKSGSTK